MEQEFEGQWLSIQSNAVANWRSSASLARAQDEFIGVRARGGYIYNTFPYEVVNSILAYFNASNDVITVARRWGTIYNPWNQRLWFDYQCQKCGKVRKMALTHMNTV